MNIPKYLSHTTLLNLKKLCKKLKILNIKNKNKKYIINKINLKLLHNLSNNNLYELSKILNIKKQNINKNALIYKINSIIKINNINFISKFYNNNLICKDYNETFGITCEYMICKIYNLKNNLKSRINEFYLHNLEIILNKVKSELVNKYKLICKEYIGYQNKSYDFICENIINNKKYNLSIKSNINGNKMVCPQLIGQCTKNSFIKFILSNKCYKNLIINSEQDIKQFIINNLLFLFNSYYKNLFCCDYLLWIKKDKNNNILSKLIKKPKLYKINSKLLKLTKNINSWKECNTLKYNKIPIGLFQIHKNRNCIKFRFNFENLLKIII
jgi:hypothetical protein